MKKLIALLLLGLSFPFWVYSQFNIAEIESYKNEKFLIDNHETDPRVHQYDVGFYHLNLEMDNNSTFVEGQTLIYINLNNTYMGELVFDLDQNMSVSEVLVNGVSKTFTHNDNLLVIPYTFTTPHNSDYEICVDVHYSGYPYAGMTCSNYEYSSTNYKITYSLSEPYEAKYWFPCKQVLTDKADSSWVFVTIPENLKAGSNGLLKNEVNLGNGYKRMEWKSKYPIAYYLISVAIGDYQDYSFYVELTGYDDSVLVQDYFVNHPTYLSDNLWYIHRVDTMLDVLSTLLGKYPFHEEKYGHCLVKLGGGMEHQTMTTLGYIDFRLVIHELGHSWFGNYLTCSTWQDIWINEGFASYVEYLGEEFIQPDGYEDGWLEDAQTRAKESLTGSVYVPFSELYDEGRIFNYILSYRKGACLVHMIRYMIDDDVVFFSMLRSYINAFGNSNASSADLNNYLNDFTDINFDTFFQNWCYGEGFPRYEIEWYQLGNTLHIRNIQTTTAEITPLFEIPMEYEIVFNSGNRDTIRLEQHQNIEDYEIVVTGTVANIVPDPDSYILKDLLSVTYTNIDKFDLPGIKISPNPCENIVNLISSVPIRDICVYSVDGRLVKKWEDIPTINSFDLSELQPGVYSFRLTDYQNCSVWTKIVKN